MRVDFDGTVETVLSDSVYRFDGRERLMAVPLRLLAGGLSQALWKTLQDQPRCRRGTATGSSTL